MNGVYTMLGEEGYGSYRLEDGRFERCSDAPTGLLTPGFVDIHIHGAFGIDAMTASTEDFRVLGRRLRANGYEGYLPTTVTAPATQVQSFLDALPTDDPMILGFHLEGPFISPAFPGAQPPQHIVKPPVPGEGWDDVLDDPRLKVITMAPEIPGALELILRLNQRGVIVSMGHTNATYEEARRGFEFGARHTTHTFNAMRGFHHREAGTVGYAFANPDLTCELIYDRLHVCPDSARILLQVKGAEGVIAVSDSTAATELPPGTPLTMWGHPVDVGRGEVRLVSNGALAGSAISLMEAFQNLAEDFGPETAIQACCHNPRRALGLTGPPRVFVEWNFDYTLRRIHEMRLSPE